MRKPLLLPFWMLLLMGHSCLSQTFSKRDLRRCEHLARQVEIIRDKWGIPHIYGKTDASAVFGLMYAQCETDFSRVEKNYLEMLGRQSEAYGDEYLATDLMMRLIYDSAQAMSEYEHSPVWMHRLLDAFADGINYFLFSHPAVRPLALRHWQPWYALMFTDGSVAATSTGGVKADEMWALYKGKLLAVEKMKKVERISPVERMILEDRGILPSKPETGEPDRAGRKDEAGEDGVGRTEGVGEDDRGSNGFAVAPSLSANGHAMLYINPHVPYYFRMEAHVVSEEGLNAYGAVTWGQFFVYQGFNAHCGWMHTSSYADVADLYVEQMHRDAKKGWTFTYDGQEKEARLKPIIIWYKKGDSVLSERLTGMYTRHGPLVAVREAQWLSLKEYNRSMPALIEAWQLTKARDLSEYKETMNIRANTTNNTVYADDHGHVAYWHGNFVPRRDTSFDWSRPVDGSITATEWKGVHALDELVHVYDPATGWIQNCNATPFTLCGPSSPVRQKYPYYMAPDGENFRGVRAAQLLGKAHGLTMDGLINIGFDNYLTAFDTLLPALFTAYEEAGEPLRQALRQPMEVLRQWDRRVDERSVGATLALEWGAAVLRYMPSPVLPEDGSYALRNFNTALRRMRAAEKLDGLAAVVRSLGERFGDWRIAWGEVCRYQRLTGKLQEVYVDTKPSMPVGQAPSTFGALPSAQSKLMPGTKRRYAYSGNSFIAVVSFGQRVEARSIVTGGESSDPASPNFSDQAEGFLKGKLKDVLFYKEDVERGRVRRYRPGIKTD